GEGREWPFANHRGNLFDKRLRRIGAMLVPVRVEANPICRAPECASEHRVGNRQNSGSKGGLAVGGSHLNCAHAYEQPATLVEFRSCRLQRFESIVRGQMTI